MFDKMKQFAASEDGAVSADWVVMTAAIVVLSLAIGTAIKNSTIDKGAEIGAEVAAM